MDPNFRFPDPKSTQPKERRIQRVLEMIPGTLTWTTILGMPLLSYFFPLVAAVFIILFDIYWVHRAIYISPLSVHGNYLVSEGKRIDWWERYQNTVHPEQYAILLRERLVHLGENRRSLPLFAWWRRHLMHKELRRTKDILRETENLIPMRKEIMDWREVLHVVLLPTAGEPAEIIEPAIQSLAEANFPKEQMIVLLATE